MPSRKKLFCPGLILIKNGPPCAPNVESCERGRRRIKKENNIPSFPHLSPLIGSKALNTTAELKESIKARRRRSQKKVPYDAPLSTMRQWKVLRWGGPLHLYGCSKTRVKRVGGRWLRNIWQVGNGPKKGERGRKQGRHFDGLAVSQQEGGERIIRAISPLKRPPIFLHTKMPIGRRGHLENVRRTLSLESSGAAHAALKSSLKLGERNPFLSFSLPLSCLILMMTYGENGSRKCAQLPPSLLLFLMSGNC